jgi:hypothetical protein
MIKEYQSLNAVSFVKEMSYCKGKAYAIAYTRKNLGKDFLPPKADLWQVVTYIRYSIHGEISTKDCFVLVRDTVSLFKFFILSPFSFILVLKDLMEGKVRRTHREFAENIQQRSIKTLS